MADKIYHEWHCHPLRAIFVWSICALFLILQFFLQLSLGVITTPLRQEFLLSAFELSVLSSAYYIIYVTLQTPAGILISRYGARNLLTIGAIVTCFGSYLFAHAHSATTAIIGRFCMGGGMAYAFIGSMYLAGRWFPARYLSLMIGIAETLAMLGAVTGNLLLANFVQILGWRQCFYIAIYFSGLLAITSWLWIRDQPKEVYFTPTKMTRKKVMTSLKILIRKPKVWCNGIYLGLMYTVITVFASLWGIPFLKTAFHLNIKQATFATSLIMVGVAVGSPIIGFLFGHHPRRKHYIIASAVVLFFLLCILLYVPQLPIFLIHGLHFCLGLCASSLILGYTISAEISPRKTRTTAIGFTNTLALMTAPICQPAIGSVLNLLGKDVPTGQLEVYTVVHYRIALSILPLLILVAICLALHEPKRKKLKLKN